MTAAERATAMAAHGVAEHRADAETPAQSGARAFRENWADEGPGGRPIAALGFAAVRIRARYSGDVTAMGLALAAAVALQEQTMQDLLCADKARTARDQ
jgi:hypothetical protein